MKKLLLATLAAATVLTQVTAASAQATTCKVGMTQYQSLASGMSYSRVAAILGCEGSEISRVDMGGFRTVMYMWEGQGSLGANMNIMIQNGKLISRAQFGLQ
jgi:Domain of Unknown Function with PDB structure (DUF3862)